MKMILVRFMGGFANQLFQYVFYERLREDFKDADIQADISFYDYNQDHGGYKLGEMVDMSYGRKQTKWPWPKIDERGFDEFCKKYKPRKNYVMNGCWQNLRFFPKDMTCVYDLFGGIKDSVENSSKQLHNKDYLKKIIATNSVAVHVRRGDYVNHQLHGFIATKAYYNNAIERVKDDINNPSFFVFSDNIAWSRENLDFGDSEVTYVEGNEKQVEFDVFLMSCCKHNIIANSSFSWWGQFLNKNEEKLVYWPPYWFNFVEADYLALKVDNGMVVSNLTHCENATTEPEASVLIKKQRDARFLMRAISSASNQTLDNIQIIILKDEMNEELLNVAKAAAKIDNRIMIGNADGAISDNIVVINENDFLAENYVKDIISGRRV